MNYQFTNIRPTKSWIDANGNGQGIYTLPQPVLRTFKHLSYGINEADPMVFSHWVSQVRICITIIDYPYRKSAVIIVPIDETGQEFSIDSLVLRSSVSVAAVMDLALSLYQA